MRKDAGVFIVPRSSHDWRGNEAGWITASCWAMAGRQLFGDSVVATTDGVFQYEESRLFPLGKASQERKLNSAVRKWVPEIFITAYKDWKLSQSKPANWPVEKWVEERQVKLVWQRHDLFPGPGKRLAEKLKVPLVTQVEATAIWESKKWGVKRPIWGSILEKRVEAKSLHASDLVSCVSEEVCEQVIRLGVPAGRTMVNPNRVDTSLFFPGGRNELVENEHQLKGCRVIGWTGSFRSFHGLDTVVAAFKLVADKHPDARLMLVGDGQLFGNIQNQASVLGLADKVILTGRKYFTAIPEYISCFDIALVSAGSTAGFHYSPLKLREYLACGKPVIAPLAGDLPKLFRDDIDLLFYQAGNVENLAERIESLLTDANKFHQLSHGALDVTKKEDSWLSELKKVSRRVNI